MFIPKAGDIVAWNNESKCTSIAVMMNEDEFSVCLNFRGRKDEENRVWEWDNVPTNKPLRRADKLEMAWLFAELIGQGYEFRAEDGKVTVRIDNEAQIDAAEHPEHSVAKTTSSLSQCTWNASSLLAINASPSTSTSLPCFTSRRVRSVRCPNCHVTIIFRLSRRRFVSV